MKQLRKVLVLVLFFSFTFVTILKPINAYASTSNSMLTVPDKELTKDEIKYYLSISPLTATTTINELDQIKALASCTYDELLNLGYSEEQARKIVDFDFNSAFMKYIQNNQDDFKTLGYNSFQIEKLESYDGSVDAIEYIEKYSLSGAELTISWSPLSFGTKDRFTIIYYASWNQVPFVGLTDMIAIGWSAYDNKSYTIGMRYAETPRCVAYYYMGNTYMYMTDSHLNQTATSYVSFKFPMLGYGGESYAKEIAGSVYLNTASNSFNLETITFTLAYGHTILGIAASPSFDFNGVSVSISFSFNTQTLYNKVRTYRYDGTLIIEV